MTSVMKFTALHLAVYFTLSAFCLAQQFDPRTPRNRFDTQPEAEAPEEEFETVEIPEELARAVFTIRTEVGSGTGFACTYKNKEWVATNLHVIAGSKVPSVRSSFGANIELNGHLVYAKEADICLLGINGSFQRYGIKPLEFSENINQTAKVEDEILCPGNSLGRGVISFTPGNIKNFGPSKLEISNPVFQGNSGGPVIHKNSNKVLGLVTEAHIANANNDNEFTQLSLESPLSAVNKITYIAHRIDTVNQWGGCTLQQYLGANTEIAKMTITTAANKEFLLGSETGWQHDERLSKIHKEYVDFLTEAYDRLERGTSVRYSYDPNTGSIIRRTSYSGLRISRVDLDKKANNYDRGVLWKIQTDLGTVEKMKVFGYLQEREKENLRLWMQMMVGAIK